MLRVDVECVGAGDGLGGLLLVVVRCVGAGDGLGKHDGFRLEQDRAREQSHGAGDGLGGLLLVVVHCIGAGDGLGKHDLGSGLSGLFGKDKAPSLAPR